MIPFNLQTYREMLQLVKAQRRIIKYSEIFDYEDFVLWRHDCDMSLNRALRIAEIDAHYGVQSTFFINPHSEFYNIFEKKQTNIINDILALKHDIGLHLDGAYHSNADSKFDIEDAIVKDTALINCVADTQLNVFSFHNPTREILGFNDDFYAGQVNCYSKKLFETVAYGSDSNGYWRHQPIPEILRDTTRTQLQILTHPEWWLEGDSPPRNRVLRCVFGRAIRLMEEYDRELEKHRDRENIDAEADNADDYRKALRIL
jgi:hypothetical protein